MQAKDVTRVSLFPELVPMTISRVSNTLGLNDGQRIQQMMYRVERTAIDWHGYESTVARQRFPLFEADKALMLFNQWCDESPQAAKEFLYGPPR